MSGQDNSVIVLGGGPAGLTAAYELSRNGFGPVTVLEADPNYLGGIARTVWHKGYGVDVGGHRFFSKSKTIEALWSRFLGNDFLERPRLSRVYYASRFFYYPLQAGDAVRKLGFKTSLFCVLSYVKARLLPVRTPRSFEDWVCNKFGRRLFEIFFKSYTEKVWGISCAELSADWAAQRIKGLSLGAAIANALRSGLPAKLRFPKEQNIKTLISHFRYPRRGPGMMWDAVARLIEQQGGAIHKNRRVTGVSFENGEWTIRAEEQSGVPAVYKARHVVSTLPLRDIAAWLDLSEAGRKAAANLRYRDFLIVALIVRDRQNFNDNWIYIQDPHLKVGRIQNFKSWSPELSASPGQNCLGLEYFCTEGDSLWTMNDDDLARMAVREIGETGLLEKDDVIDSFVIRQRKAYPVYDIGYSEHVNRLRGEIESRYPSLHLAGRNGLHRYNNMDHAMITGLLAAQNVMAGRRQFDVWAVNEDASYHEETGA